MIALQSKFDELENAGVFAKPEQVNVSVEYLNLSFLVKKTNGGHRLVTSFGEVGRTSKPQPSLMPQVDNVLRDIAKWKFIIITDLLQSFYQIPLAHDSMKYCGVSTPFKGIRVYTRCAMGMPGSKTCLEELMSRILGDLIQQGRVAKIADDLYVGGNTPEEALFNYECVLQALSKNDLRLSARKTLICPRSATILGWIWSDGCLSASPHRLLTLQSTPQPSTVHSLRSFIGSYKVLSRVLKGYAGLLHPLEKAVAGKPSREKVVWTDDLSHAFTQAKVALRQAKVITIPLPQDQLWIVTDASVKPGGLAATLYALRDGKLLLAGFFNSQLKKHQITWLPCELEAVAIGTAIKHFSPYIVQSHHITQVLTDSRPCVQAQEKLSRGEFSASSRVSTFLSLVSRFQIHVRHITGAANLPSDYSSRHPIICREKTCQICKFINELKDSFVREISVKDITDGTVKMPFMSRVAWHATQQECSDLRRAHAYLTQGTRPSKKLTNIPDVKRYLRFVTIASDSVLVVCDVQQFQPVRERIVVPRAVLHGLITAIHLRFNHPSPHQLKLLVSRYFYALDVDNALKVVSTSCHHCLSLKALSPHLLAQSTGPPPDKIGLSFACDIMRRYKQFIMILRESSSSFTMTSLIDSEKHDHVRDSLLIMCAELRPLGDDQVTIRVDAAPCFVALVKDPVLLKNNITLEVGRIKNVNKNPVAERAVQELGIECLKLSPEGGPLSKVSLALVTANLNACIRRGGLSSREVWTQRDQICGDQLPIRDQDLILQQHHARKMNHQPSIASKLSGRPPPSIPCFKAGELVFLHCDGAKTNARPKYIIVDIVGDLYKIRKFTLSQFRSKTYEVRASDCYPVTPSPMISTDEPIRGINPPDDDSESDCESTAQLDIELNSINDQHPPISPVLTEVVQDEYAFTDIEPDELQPLDMLHASPHTAPSPETNSQSSSLNETPSRLPRSRQAPAWQRSGDWMMN